MELRLFDEVCEVVRSLVPAELGEVHGRSHGYGVKVWLGGPKPGREHYEAQVIGTRHVPAATVLALEIGFHAEHPDERKSEATLQRLLQAEKRWRKVLGDEPEAGAFLGNADWRRVSETWIDPDLSEDGLAFEIGARLTDYVTTLEPLLRP